MGFKELQTQLFPHLEASRLVRADGDPVEEVAVNSQASNFVFEDLE